MSPVKNSAPGVENTLLSSILTAVRAAVLVLTSSGYLTWSPRTVKRIRSLMALLGLSADVYGFAVVWDLVSADECHSIGARCHMRQVTLGEAADFVGSGLLPLFTA